MRIGIRAQANKELQKWSQNVLEHFQRTIIVATHEVTLGIKERAILNAPIDTEELRDTMDAPKPKMLTIHGSPAAEGQVTVTVPYAFKMHEALEPYGSGPFQRGKRSRLQPDTREGGVGGKYLKRALEKNIEIWRKSVGDTVKKNLGGAAKSTKVIVTPLRRIP